MQPEPDETICDPACGTGGFLLAAHDYIAKHHKLDKDEKKHLKLDALRGWEIVDSTARLCAMNLVLHGIGGDETPDLGGRRAPRRSRRAVLDGAHQPAVREEVEHHLRERARGDARRRPSPSSATTSGPAPPTSSSTSSST